MTKSEDKMSRSEAIRYLRRKGKINLPPKKYPEEVEERIKEVQKKGKIYGDPLVELSE